MGECGGVRARMIRCREVSGNGQVSESGGMGRSGQVIGGMIRSDQASRWTSGHDEQMWRDVERCGEMWRGVNRCRGVESSL